MDIECVQVLKTLRAGKKTIQPGIYYAPLDRILIDEVRAGSRVVVTVGAGDIASVAGSSSTPVNAFKNEIKRLNTVCEGLKKELEIAEVASGGFGSSYSENKDLIAENEELKSKNDALRGDLEVQVDNVKKLLDEKASIIGKQPMKKGGKK